MSKVIWVPSNHQAPADLAVVIVSWNVKEILLKNIESLEQSEGSMTAHLIVIDNASRDGSVVAVRERFPWVTVIANEDNRGFAAACNQGIVARNARHILLLNPDMTVEPDALQKTVDYLDAHSDVAVVGGQLLSARDEKFHSQLNLPSVRRFPDFWSQLLILLKLPHVFPKAVNHYLWKDFDYTKEQAVDSVRGSYFAMHERALKELGMLDPRFFIWFEEVDYCKQAITKNWKVMYVPTIRATDLMGRSFAQTKRYLSQKRFTRSMVQYFEKWEPRWQTQALKAVRPLALGMAWVADKLSFKPRIPPLTPPSLGGVPQAITSQEKIDSINALNPQGSPPSEGGVRRGMPRIAIQIISYFSSKHLALCLESLKRQTFTDWKLFVCENSCNREEAGRVQKMLEESGVPNHLFISPANIGFAGGHQTLYVMNDAPFVLLLNDDAKLEPSYLENVLRRMESDPKIGSVTGLVYRWMDGDERIIDTTGLEYECLGKIVDRFAGMTVGATRRVAPTIDTVGSEVYGISGAVAFYRRSAVDQVGRLFDPSWFMYKEDVDLAMRLRRAGFKAWFEPMAVAFHQRGLKEEGTGFFERLKSERKRPAILREFSYANQWKLYRAYFRSTLSLRDIFQTIGTEAARSVFVFLASPVVFFRAWKRILLTANS